MKLAVMVNIPELVASNSGDGTVVAEKAIEPLKDIDYKPGSYGTHPKVLKSEDLQNGVYKYLTDSNIPPIRSISKGATSTTTPATTFSLYLTGGIQPYMTDPQHRTEGLNFITNQVEENIPNTTLNLGNSSSSIFINNPVVFKVPLP
ncbi:MAG: hypothetical protein SFH39_00560 [Candidatus Magnetobacterium sp. LHC-1]